MERGYGHFLLTYHFQVGKMRVLLGATDFHTRTRTIRHAGNETFCNLFGLVGK
jgi:hypothetical protein